MLLLPNHLFLIHLKKKKKAANHFLQDAESRIFNDFLCICDFLHAAPHETHLVCYPEHRVCKISHSL